MSAQVKFDIIAASRLRSELIQMKALLKEDWYRVSAKAAALLAVWHDPQRDTFQEYFDKQIKAPYANVMAALDVHIGFLDVQISQAEKPVGPLQ